MASRDGARAGGTDGSDFAHRETVASHYKASAESKRRLKGIIVAHMIITIYQVVKLFPKVLQLLFGIDIFSVPEPDVWDWVYIFSSIFIFSLMVALKKNNVTAMKTYVVGISVTAILPLLWAITCLLMSDDLKTLIVYGRASDKIERFNGVPLVAVKLIVVSGAFILHVFSIMCAKHLINVWTPKRGKKA